MIVLACSKISMSFGVNKILDDVALNIQKNEKVGLVGANGAGKSTLFKIISGKLQQDSGDIYLAKGCRVGYLEQDSGLDSENTIWDELISIYSGLIQMEHRIKHLEKEISIEKNDDRLSALMNEYSSLAESFSSSGGYEYNSRVRGVLRGLGFDDSQFDLKVHVLSGGQKTRLALARMLLKEPDIMLLDEPTNHLDISAVEWLEDFLKNYRKSVFIISHDRYFLDVVTDKTIELENSQCRTYNGNYTSYAAQKAIDRDIHQKHYDMQQKEIARLEAFIEQQKQWNRERNIIAAESRQKAIEKMEKTVMPKKLPGKINIRLKSGIISGNDVLFVENLSKAFPGKPLFCNISFELKKNEKVFLLGPNGCGKSTLLKILSGKLVQSSGTFEYGHKIVTGYYDQEQEDLDTNNSILEEVYNCGENLTQTQIRTTLAAFLFKGDDVFKPISALSGGEKSRVSLAKLMLSGANFLILDEPTNHLDINSREALEEALQAFDGTLLIVSHDRYLINKLASRILELSDNSLLNCNGNYSFYLEYRNTLKKDSGNRSAKSSLSISKHEHIQSKEDKARQRRLEKQINGTEEEIGSIEARLAVIESEMLDSSSDHVALAVLHEEQTMLQKKLDELYKLWESLSGG